MSFLRKERGEQQRTGHYGTATGTHRETRRVRATGRRHRYRISQEPGRQRVRSVVQTPQLGRTPK